MTPVDGRGGLRTFAGGRCPFGTEADAAGSVVVIRWIVRERTGEGRAMARYDYCCSSCGTVEVLRRMGDAGAAEPCPTCGRAARRLFSIPGVSSAGSLAAGLQDRADRSAHEPTVVSGGPPPGRRVQRRSSDPRHQRLPRP